MGVRCFIKGSVDLKGLRSFLFKFKREQGQGVIGGVCAITTSALTSGVFGTAVTGTAGGVTGGGVASYGLSWGQEWLYNGSKLTYRVIICIKLLLDL